MIGRKTIRITAWLLVLAMIQVMLSVSPAVGEHGAWDCPACGRTGNTGNYCGNCGNPAPWLGADQEAASEPDIVRFGHSYYGNDPEPLEWIVLETQGTKALLISRYLLGRYGFHNKSQPVTWSECALRSWLNGAFLEGIFTDDERKAILDTPIDGGSDKLFLPDADEVTRWFADEQSRAGVPLQSLPDHAAKSSDWWLRSAGSGKNETAVVCADGGIGSVNVNSWKVMIRPALWADLSRLQDNAGDSAKASRRSVVLKYYPLLFPAGVSEIISLFDEMVEQSREWDEKTAPQTLSDVPLFPDEWFTLPAVNFAFRKLDDYVVMDITDPPDFSLFQGISSCRAVSGKTGTEFTIVDQQKYYIARYREASPLLKAKRYSVEFSFESRKNRWSENFAFTCSADGQGNRQTAADYRLKHPDGQYIRWSQDSGQGICSIEIYKFVKDSPKKTVTLVYSLETGELTGFSAS